MSGINNLKAEKGIKAFQRSGWTVERQKGSHVHLSKEGNANILSIPVHKGKAVKQGLLRSQIAKAGMTVEEFLKLYL
ncbi:MAG: type II toxin-antitoxin system HicA family toxin [Nitrospirae bacterium]|nr:type II toxin-antitoxin system HicA family toxin [Nitrospirota bacterium]